MKQRKPYVSEHDITTKLKEAAASRGRRHKWSDGAVLVSDIDGDRLFDVDRVVCLKCGHRQVDWVLAEEERGCPGAPDGQS